MVDEKRKTEMATSANARDLEYMVFGYFFWRARKRRGGGLEKRNFLWVFKKWEVER